MHAGKQLRDAVLRHVRVLVFVNQDIAEPVLVLFEYVRVFLEQTEGQKQQIVKIDGVALL